MKFWTITSKDLRLLVRDRRALVTLILFPLVFITIIGLTTGQVMGWKDSNQIIRIAAVDAVDYDNVVGQSGRTNEQERQRARNLVVWVLNELQKQKGLRVTEAASRPLAEQMYLEGRANVALIIGPEFYDLVNDLDMASLEQLRDGLGRLDLELLSSDSAASTHAIIEQLIFGGIVLDAVYPYVLCRERAEGSGLFSLGANAQMVRRCAELTDRLDGPLLELDPPPPVEAVRDDAVYRELIPGFTVMFVFFLVNIMARSFIQEREIGTLRRLRMAPVRPSSLLMGKTAPFFLISVAQTLLLFGFGRLLFDMSWGPRPALLLPVMFTCSMAATALGLLLATVVRTDSQVSAYANFLVISLAGISGCFMPRDWLPDFMQTISLATPHAWALKAYDQLLRGASRQDPDLTIVATGCAMLVAFSAAFFLLGAIRFRRGD
ncbi:MAG TPA: ABC transporter permease [Planctomycetaceae bacterium]|nr:ABC transporter permease [Planctomycetaceae bacterium]